MKKNIKKEIKVNFEDQKTTVDILADSIYEISEGIKKLRNTKLNEKALLILIHGCVKSTGGYSGRKPSQTEIKSVIEAIESLSKVYLK